MVLSTYDKRPKNSVFPGLILLGSAINQDGRSSSLTAPHGPAQQLVMSQALKKANIHPSEIELLSLHGTGRR